MTAPLSVDWLEHIGEYEDYCATNGLDPRIPLYEARIDQLERVLGQRDLQIERLNGERTELHRVLKQRNSQ